MDEKQLARKEALARRDALASDLRAQKSAQVCEELELLVNEWFGEDGARDGDRPGNCCLADGTRDDASGVRLAGDARTAAPVVADEPRHVAVYAAIRSELDLGVFVGAAYARGWDVCFPCMVRDDCGSPSGEPHMAFVSVSRETLRNDPPAFVTHPVRSWTMLQLADAGFSVIAPARLDAVVVPLVGFDADGMRLGYGGGNYDRFLPHVRSDALIVGVAFAEQQLAHVPTELHDQPLPRILSA